MCGLVSCGSTRLPGGISTHCNGVMVGDEQSLHRLAAIDDQGVSDDEGSRV
jgi:hypothetical protein